MSAVLSFLTSRAGAYAAVAAVIGALGLTVYVQHLRIAARDAKIGQLSAEIETVTGVNDRQAALIDSLTTAAADAKRRATAAEMALARAKGAVQTKTITITREVERAATPSDDAPVTPAVRAALAGLVREYGHPNGH